MQTITKERIKKILELLSFFPVVSLSDAVKECYGNTNRQSTRLFNRDVFLLIEPVVTKDYDIVPNLTRKGKIEYNRLLPDTKLHDNYLKMFEKITRLPRKSIRKSGIKQSKKKKCLKLDYRKITQMWLDGQIFMNSEKRNYERRDDNAIVIVSAMFGSSPHEQKITKVLNDLSKNELFLNHLSWYFSTRIRGESIPNFKKILGEDYIGLLQLREVSDFIDKKLKTSEIKKKVFLTLLKRYSYLIKNHRIKLAIDLEKLSYHSIDAMKVSLI